MFSNPTTAERVGDLLRRERGIAGFTQRVLAERIGVDRASVARWECGSREPTLAQVEQVLALYQLRLALELEPLPDPGQLWTDELSRLAALTPAERLAETGFALLPLAEQLQRMGSQITVDRTLAGWLAGVPDTPRRMTVVSSHSRLREWMGAWRIVRGLVDEDLMPIYLGRDPDQLVERGRFLLSTAYGVLDVRAVSDADLPPAEPLDIGGGVSVDVSWG